MGALVARQRHPACRSETFPRRAEVELRLALPWSLGVAGVFPHSAPGGGFRVLGNVPHSASGGFRVLGIFCSERLWGVFGLEWSFALTLSPLDPDLKGSPFGTSAKLGWNLDPSKQEICFAWLAENKGNTKKAKK